MPEQALPTGAGGVDEDPRLDLAAVPPVLSRAVEAIRSVQGDPRALRRRVDRSAVPILMADSDRRYTHMNGPARLLFRLSLEEALELRIDDLTPPEQVPGMETAWHELMTSGSVAGDYDVGLTDGSRLQVVYWAMRDAVPGEHLVVFAPSGWRQDEFSWARERRGWRDEHLTERELQVLRLAAEGRSTRGIADALVIAHSTVKTHLANIYAKLDAPDRAAAVAEAIRRGLID